MGRSLSRVLRRATSMFDGGSDGGLLGQHANGSKRQDDAHLFGV